MNSAQTSQADFSLDFYNDLDVIMDGRIEIADRDYTSIILTVNGREIEIDGETAQKIFEALEVRINNKIDRIEEVEAERMTEVDAVLEYENRIREAEALGFALSRGI